MRVRLAISRRRAKILAAATIWYVRSIRMWHLTMYSVTLGQVAMFGSNPFDTLEDALANGNEMLNVRDEDWVLVPEEDVDRYIRDHARNRWNPTQRKRRS